MVAAEEPRWQVSDEEILNAVTAAVDDGVTDLLAGGVPAREVAERRGIAKSTALARLHELSESPALVCVWGAQPVPPYRPRRSYLPPETAETIAQTTQFSELDKSL